MKSNTLKLEKQTLVIAVPISGRFNVNNKDTPNNLRNTYIAKIIR